MDCSAIGVFGGNAIGIAYPSSEYASVTKRSRRHSEGLLKGFPEAGRWVGPNMSGTGRRVFLNAWHQDQVVVPPSCADVTATSDFCKYATLSYGDRAISIQPHPEFTGEFIKAMIEKRGCGIVPDELLDRARQVLKEPDDSGEFADLIAKFFKAALGPGPRQLSAT